ncbi:MAG: hypothetical protein HOQ05_14400 [Corynebacteriales bacterium]|nr:hypothetical protein [Mycobacteriales bacterium]
MSHQEHQLVDWNDVGLATLADWLPPRSSITVCYWIGPHLMAARPMSVERIDSRGGELRAWLTPGTKCRAIKTHHDGKPHLWNQEDISSPSQDDEWIGSHVAFQFPLNEAGYTRAKLRPGPAGSRARVREYYHDIGAIVGWSAHLHDGAVVPWAGNRTDEVLTPHTYAGHASFALHVQD